MHKIIKINIIYVINISIKYIFFIFLLTSCNSTKINHAPIIDISNILHYNSLIKSGKLSYPFYYKIAQGDNLYRIALNLGQDYRNIMLWNNISNPNQIKTNDLLKILNPDVNYNNKYQKKFTREIKEDKVQVIPFNKLLNNNIYSNKKTDEILKNNNLLQEYNINQKLQSKSQKKNVKKIMFEWPINGSILDKFNILNNKGINIEGKSGMKVYASESGYVMYAGNGLRGYGNLIIIRHNKDYTTVYAHNKSLLVKEGEKIDKKQIISIVGNTDTNRIMLHFEIRYQGNPVNPLDYLSLKH